MRGNVREIALFNEAVELSVNAALGASELSVKIDDADVVAAEVLDGEENLSLGLSHGDFLQLCQSSQACTIRAPSWCNEPPIRSQMGRISKVWA